MCVCVCIYIYIYIWFRLSRVILTALCMFLWLQWLPESARFHVASGQPDEALATLQRVAKENGKPMLLGRLVVDDSASLAPRGRVTHLIRPELRKTSLLLWFIWWEGVYYLMHLKVVCITLGAQWLYWLNCLISVEWLCEGTKCPLFLHFDSELLWTKVQIYELKNCVSYNCERTFKSWYATTE